MVISALQAPRLLPAVNPHVAERLVIEALGQVISSTVSFYLDCDVAQGGEAAAVAQAV
jgi:hypothetical protein